jgi:hypothetical protein
MALCRHHLPGFKVTCIGVGAVFALLAAGELARGVAGSMDGFGIPAATLASPHYRDAMTWVFVHMLVLGGIIGAVGCWVGEARARTGFARVMTLAMLVFTALDLRTSDSALGNHLYAGARTLVPPIIDVVVLLLFAHLAFCASASANVPKPR